jgi:chromosome segregation ATPase
LNECKEQLQAKEGELAEVKHQLQNCEMKVNQLEGLAMDLVAAKEEIAVKVAQVKQYQKQVEAYKQQVCGIG